MGESDWSHKQDAFLAFLQKYDADGKPYRVDLAKQKIYWVDDMGLSLVVADCRVILTYALSNHSVMMAWANSSLAEGAAIDPIPEMPEIYSDCDEYDVWELAMRGADSVEAEAIYRTPSPQSWVMLAIWNLRPGGAEQFTSGSPKGHILRVLESLVKHEDIEERQVLLDNYAESFLQMASHPYKGTDYADPLRNTARELRNLLAMEPEEQSEKLSAVREDWESRE